MAGVVWQTLHYLLGFERLGYEAYYVETHARTPGMLMERESDDSSARAAAFVDRVMRRFGLGNRWAFYGLHDDNRCFGMSATQLHRLYRDALCLINLHGGTEPRPELYETDRFVYLETDPVQLQTELHYGLQASFDFLEPHCSFFTYAENYGNPDCKLPTQDRFPFHPTRQPVIMDLWSGRGTAGERFTTVGNWRQPWREIELDGEMYSWSKHHEFMKFIDLPQRTDQPFELALSSYEPEDKAMLEEQGWKVRARARLLDRHRRLPRLRDRLARRVHRRQGPERPAAHGLVQRPQHHLPRRGPPGDQPGHGLLERVPDRRGTVRLLHDG